MISTKTQADLFLRLKPPILIEKVNIWGLKWIPAWKQYPTMIKPPFKVGVFRASQGKMPVKNVVL